MHNGVTVRRGGLDVFVHGFIMCVAGSKKFFYGNRICVGGLAVRQVMTAVIIPLPKKILFSGVGKIIYLAFDKLGSRRTDIHVGDGLMLSVVRDIF